MDDRRGLPRWEIMKESKFWLSQTQDFNLCTIKDIHLKGMCISSNKQLPQQDSLKLSFAIGESFDFIKIEAGVQWKSQDQGRYVYGLSFNRIDEENKDKVYQYVMENCYDQLKNRWWA